MKRFSIVLIFLFIILETFAQKDSLIGRKPFVLGTINELQSAVLSEKRVLNIYLPDDYNEKDTIKYPVIYLLDGSADEDFIHIVGLVQFLNFPWVNILPKSIVVGIANVDRRRDYTFPTTIAKDKKDFPTTGKSENFINFLEKELQPYIERNYKTTAIKTIIGQSLGGLFATEILFKKPHLFTNYIIISPSLWWDNESLLTIAPALLARQPDKKTKVYISVGKEGKQMEDDSRHLAEILHASDKSNLQLIFLPLPNETHLTILHNSVYKGFELLYPKKTN